MKKVSLALFLVSLMALLSACGGGVTTDNSGSDGIIDTTAPTAVATPAIGSIFGGKTPIMVTFSETMVPGSLVLSGSLASYSDGGAWSTKTHSNDTLTIKPKATWPDGAQTLIVDAHDAAGNALSSLSLTYQVDVDAAQGIPNPQTGARILNNRRIVITYDEAMDSSSHMLSGTLAAQSNGGSWSTKTFANDTLTIVPISAWTEGNGTLVVDARDVAGNPAVVANLNYIIDATAPTPSVSPPSGSAVWHNTQIQITFDESMATDSLVLTGSMVSDAAPPAWTAVTHSNDSLLISPASGWTTGAGTLSIEVNDAAGNGITIDLNYTITTACNPPAMLCSDGCKDLASDPMNCGGCGISCGDGNDCTADVCISGICNFIPLMAGTACSTDGGAVCDETARCVPNCDDGVLCTIDFYNGACYNVPTDFYCDDGNICTINEYCDPAKGCTGSLFIGDTGSPCYTGPAGTQGVGICHGGTYVCAADGTHTCSGEVLPKPEVCGNHLDDNCNGVVDTDCQY